MTAQPSTVSRRSAPLPRPRFYADASPSSTLTPQRYRPGALVFTPRELNVLRLVAHGRDNIQIGDELGVSVRSVERHIANIYLKVNTTVLEIPTT